MSRTYRFNKGKDAYRIKDSWVLRDHTFQYFGDGEYEWKVWGDVQIDPRSIDGKKRLARFHSDAKHHVMIWNGPSWFHRLYSQKPYRMRVRKELHKYTRCPDHEVVIENKPPREYWW